MPSSWIVGTTRSGKTDRLVAEFRRWVEIASQRSSGALSGAVLVFAANNDNRRNLSDRLVAAVEGSYPVISKTPLGFISDEVMLFWPLLFEQLQVKAQFPLRLRPETEQELATQLWHDAIARDNALPTETSQYRFVRQTLDLLQLAGAAGIAAEDIPKMLELGLMADDWDGGAANPAAVGESSAVGQLRGELLLQWRQWCWERGLLSYGIIYELYWRYLLPDATYQYHFIRRYQAIFADDTDDYPAIARDLIEVLLDNGATGVFTFNPNGKIRLGLNADPNSLEGIAHRCTVEELPKPPSDLGETAVQLATGFVFDQTLPNRIRSLQATSRASLLRQTAEVIIESVQRGEVQPHEIAIIAPGLDAIARYTLLEILAARGIAVEPLNEQRPLITSPPVRALLTLLAFTYPGLGRFLDRDSVAEMLVVLSHQPTSVAAEGGRVEAVIDPARAGLIADSCFDNNLQHPRLLEIETFPRWDRLGHRATVAYQKICAWIEEARALQDQSPSVLTLLDRAIKHFLLAGSSLPFDRLAALRELIESAQHFWEVDRRLKQNEPTSASPADAIAQFIQLLRRGTVTANAYPARPLGVIPQNAVTLATIFQYRSSRGSHRWHFWLDASSPLWEKGGAATLFAAPLFLQEWSGFPWTPEDQVRADRDRTERILRDLIARAEERIYLCHSDLAANGSEQSGPLLPLVYAAVPLEGAQGSKAAEV
ncbi:MAG: recombinase family protein [Cyanobacteriota bacterium]|nr:recombinase family protein [Cyanobacteriota bacterium]